MLQHMTTAEVTGGHVLAVPGRREALALTDACPTDGCELVTPATVLDEVERGRCVGRIASYRCPRCGQSWLCWWGPAGHG